MSEREGEEKAAWGAGWAEAFVSRAGAGAAMLSSSPSGLVLFVSCCLRLPGWGLLATVC